MPLQAVNVPIDLGKGVDESADAFRLQPPFSATVANMRPEHDGSLSRRPGFAELNGVTGGANANVLVADGDRALLLGPSPAKLVTAAAASSLEHASPLPLTLHTHRLRAVQGFGHSAQIARNEAGYTAVIVSILGDVTTWSIGANPGNYLQHDYLCELMIFDADWHVVWGPYRVGVLKWLPRVEPISNNRFVFFALGTSTAGAEFPWQKGALSEPIGLYTAQGGVGGSAPSATLAASVSPVADPLGDTEGRWKIYDTHASENEDLAYAAFVHPNNAQADVLRVIGTHGAGAPTYSIDLAISSSTRNHSVSIWRDESSDAVLVHHAGDTRLHYGIGTLSAMSNISAPALDGVGAASTVDLFAGSRVGGGYQVPEFYVHANGGLYLNEHRVTLTGVSPGVPSFSGSIGAQCAHLFKPRAFVDETMFIRAQIAYGDAALQRVGFGSWLELYRLADHPAYAKPQPLVDLSILETRFGAESLGHYTFETAVEDGGTRTWPCVVGQNAVTPRGTLLVPSLPLTDQQHVRSETTGVAASLSNTSINLETYNTLTSGAGYYNDEQYLVVSEVDATVPTYSAESHEASMMIAAGVPSMWSGATVHPIVPRRPLLFRYNYPNLLAIPESRQVDPTTVNVLDASDTGSAEYIDYGRNFLMRGVLVFTDANGIEYRSAPSPALSSVGITTDGTFPEFCPPVDVLIEPSTLAFLGAGRSLDLELYVTERRDADGGDPDESTYTLVNRMPLQKDDDGWFVIDLMQDLVVHLNALGGTYEDAFQNPPHVTPLYTASGEKANLPPPASHVSAQVAGYAFLLASENAYEVWVSKPLVKGRGPEWNPELVIYAPPASGGVVSLASGYDRLYLLCRRGVWEQPVYNGPAATGGVFTAPPQVVYRGQGCISHMGTVETPSGIFYVTTAGPRLLTGEGSVDIGKAVRTAIDWTAIVAATYDPNADEVTWWTSDPEGDAGGDPIPAPGGTAITLTTRSVSYSLRFGAWSTSTLGARAAAVWDDGVIRLRDSLALVQETTETTLDGPSTVLSQVTSPWLSFGDIQGYKRVWEVTILGRIERFNSGGLRIGLEYDYVDGIVDRYDWTRAQIAALSRGLQLSVKPKRQQVDAIRITVQQTSEQTGVDQGGQPVYQADMDWTITGIDVRVGAKAGLMKLEAGAKK